MQQPLFGSSALCPNRSTSGGRLGFYAFATAMLAGLLACGIGCREPNYNTEAIPNEQGGVTLVRTPKTPDQVQAEEQMDRPAMAAAPLPPPPPADPDLASVESDWPHLSPTDRQRVADMARRLAQPSPQP